METFGLPVWVDHEQVPHHTILYKRYPLCLKESIYDTQISDPALYVSISYCAVLLDVACDWRSVAAPVRSSLDASHVHIWGVALIAVVPYILHR